MGAFANSFAILFAHPILGGLCFLGVLFGVVFLFSGGAWREAWGGLGRIFATIFTTPFEFLRNALGIIRSAKSAEAGYAGTREFVLFRYSRIQYLTIFAISVLLISSGVTAGLMALYPQAEFAESKRLGIEAKDLKARFDQTQQTIRDADKPGFRATLETRLTKARADFNGQLALIGQKKAANSFTGAILNQIDASGDQDALNAISGGVDTYFSGCPGGFSPMGYSWIGWVADQCQAYKAYAVDQIAQKTKLFSLGAALDQAQRDLDQTANVVANARSEAVALQGQIDANAQARKAASAFSPKVIWRHLLAAIITLLSSALVVIGFVWFASIALDVLNWIILMMRSLEAEHEKRIPPGAAKPAAERQAA